MGECGFAKDFAVRWGGGFRKRGHPGERKRSRRKAQRTSVLGVRRSLWGPVGKQRFRNEDC